ncbi:MAG: PilW family protein [Desulfobacteraceae bacterium]
MTGTDNKFCRNAGFTLIEILIALAVSGFFLLALTSFFISTNRVNTVQEKVAGVQQDIRAVMEMMSGNVMMAGLDPSQTAACAGFYDGASYSGAEIDKNDTDQNSISIKYDHDGDGGCEFDLSYWYDSAADTIMFRNGAGQPFSPLTENGTIDSAVFTYILDDGTVDNDPTGNGNLGDISMVRIRICGKITGAFKDEFDNTYCFENEIKLRNM